MKYSKKKSYEVISYTIDNDNLREIRDMAKTYNLPESRVVNMMIRTFIAEIRDKQGETNG